MICIMRTVCKALREREGGRKGWMESNRDRWKKRERE